MKRYWYLMAIAATLLASCNKDEEETEIQGFKVLEYRPAPVFSASSFAKIKQFSIFDSPKYTLNN